MELKHLLSYATVVRLGSFSRAAEELYIAQPTISLHIRQLEEELGTKLLLRTTKNIEVTEKGREVYECAVNILQLRDRITEKCSDGERRIIRLGASTIPSAYILPEVLPAYVSRHPATYFTIDQGDSRSVTEKLAEGVIDIALIGMKPASSDILAEPFYEDSVVVITPVREPFLSMKENNSATLKKLFEAPVILREEGSGSLKAADAFLAKAGYTAGDLRVAFVTTHIPLEKVPSAVTFDRIVTVTHLLRDAIVAEGIVHPRIAVAALNPHAGENGDLFLFQGIPCLFMTISGSGS